MQNKKPTVYLMNGGIIFNFEKFSKTMQLRPYQRQYIESVLTKRQKHRKILLVAPTGSGKAQPLSANILTPTGYRKMGDLSIGDLVIGSNGKATEVTDIYPQGIKPVFRVTMTDGSSTICCDDHLWAVRTPDQKVEGKGFTALPLSTIRTKYITSVKANDRCPSGTRLKYFIPLVQPVEFDLPSDLPVDPYALGLLLGDGCLSRTNNISFSCPDNQLQDALSKALPKPCYLLQTERAIDFRIVGGGNNTLLHILRDLDLMGKRAEDKHIPEIYKLSNIENRIAILQGLFDTDGHAMGAGSVEYMTVSKQLSDDVTFIVNSLGGTVNTVLKTPTFTYRGEKRIGQLAYRMTVKLPESIVPFRLERKRDKFLATYQSRFVPRRGISKIEEVEPEECQCISVAADDHLYVTDDFIVTHNTATTASLIQQLISEGKRVLFVVDAIELIDQAYKAFRRENLPCGFIKAGYPENPKAAVQIASIQTLTARAEWRKQHFDAVILDEAHITTWYKGIEDLTSLYPDAMFLGLTATPYSSNKKRKLGIFYDTLISHTTPKELQDQGYLVPLSYYGIGEPDLSKIRTKNFDYDTDDLKTVCDTDEAIDNAVQAWFRLAQNRKTVVFCISLSHAQNVLKTFQKHGVNADIVTGSITRSEREKIYKKLRDGITRVLINVNCLNKGFDEPSLEVALMLRPTKSKSLCHQQIGRITRLSDGKDSGLVIDMVGNIKRHGFIESVTGYRLEYPNDAAEAGELPLKDCPICGALHYGFVKVCTCGYEFPVKEKEETLADVKKLFADAAEQEQFDFYRSKLRECFDQGHHPFHAIYTFQGLYKKRPPQDWALGAIFNGKATRENVALYQDVLRKARVNQKTSVMALNAEFGLQWKAHSDRDLAVEFMKGIKSSVLKAFTNNAVRIRQQGQTLEVKLENPLFDTFFDSKKSEYQSIAKKLNIDVVFA